MIPLILFISENSLFAERTLQEFDTSQKLLSLIKKQRPA